MCRCQMQQHDMLEPTQLAQLRVQPAALRFEGEMLATLLAVKTVMTHQ